MSDETKNSQFGIGQGITITTGFDVATQKPLDARTVVHDLVELGNMPAGMIYLGLTVFVISENKLYQRKYKVDEDGFYIKDDQGNIEEEWGPIESEISSKDIEVLEEIDFDNAPNYLLQKNKKDFFPLTHESAVFVDYKTISYDGDNNVVYGDKVNGKVISDKYQTIVDPTLKTLNKTIPGAINEVNDYLDEKLKVFNDKLAEKLAEIDRQVQRAEDSIEQAEQDMQDKLDQVEDDINDRVDQMLQDVDNVILSDQQCNYLMDQIRANIALLDGGSSAIVAATFRAYNSAVNYNTSFTEVPLSSLGVETTSNDKLFVHMNSVYLTEGVDYIIDYNNQKIKNITANPWNKYLIKNCEVAFDLIKVIDAVTTNEAVIAMAEAGETPALFSTRSSTNGIRSFSASVEIDRAVNEMSLNVLGIDVSTDDKLFVHLNSVLLTEGVDYTIDYGNQKIINRTDTQWNSYNIEDCEFTFDLIKKPAF